MLAHLRSTHSLPRFDGPRSRGHHAVPLWRLHLRALGQRLRAPRRFAEVETFIQFVGFPRSGHSLVGSLLDAHAEAAVAHELDAMGLIEAGFPERAIYALIADNAATFSRHGRYWNGYRYQVPDHAYQPAAGLRVIGDKKGDWVARRIGRTPELVERLRAALRARTKWVLVVRDPFDNIATMSLRRGRAYDGLRIENPDGAAFRTALSRHQASGEIASHVPDEMIADYRTLCQGVEALRSRVPAEDWLEVHHDDLTTAPDAGIRRLLAFLDLPAEDGFVRAAASIVQPSGHSSRKAVEWRPGQRAEVAAIAAMYPFLARYGETGGGSTGQPPPI